MTNIANLLSTLNSFLVFLLIRFPQIPSKSRYSSSKKWVLSSAKFWSKVGFNNMAFDYFFDLNNENRVLLIKINASSFLIIYIRNSIYVADNN